MTTHRTTYDSRCGNRTTSGAQSKRSHKSYSSHHATKDSAHRIWPLVAAAEYAVQVDRLNGHRDVGTSKR